ncbi:MAG: IS200/IS605 family transposase [Pyrinomonadaceae bacterium]
MPFVRVWIHCVWSTKNRELFLGSKIREEVFLHILENAKQKKIYIDSIGGYVDHVHCLISLGTDQTIAEIMRLLKGESSHWINKNKMSQGKFEWQDEYFAVSVSEIYLPRVRKYIGGQEEHHKKTSFIEEFSIFMKRAGFERYED